MRKLCLLLLMLLFNGSLAAQCPSFNAIIGSHDLTACASAPFSFDLTIDGVEEDSYEVWCEVNGEPIGNALANNGFNTISVSSHISGDIAVDVYVSNGVGEPGNGCQEYLGWFSLEVGYGDDVNVTVSTQPSCLAYPNGEVLLHFPDFTLPIQSVELTFDPPVGNGIEVEYLISEHSVVISNVPQGEYTLNIANYSLDCLSSTAVELEIGTSPLENSIAHLIGYETIVGCGDDVMGTFVYEFQYGDFEPEDWTVYSSLDDMYFEVTGEGSLAYLVVPLGTFCSNWIHNDSLYCPVWHCQTVNEAIVGCTDENACNWVWDATCADQSLCSYYQEIAVETQNSCCNINNGTAYFYLESGQSFSPEDYSYELIGAGGSTELVVSGDSLLAINLAPGEYSFQISNGFYYPTPCIDDAISFVINADPAIEVAQVAIPTCPLHSNGGLQLSVAEGSIDPEVLWLDMNFNWIAGSNTNQGQYMGENIFEIPGFSQGDYSVELTNSELNFSQTIEFTISENEGSPYFVLSEILPGTCGEPESLQIVLESYDGSAINPEDWISEDGVPGDWYIIAPAAAELSGSQITFSDFAQCGDWYSVSLDPTSDAIGVCPTANLDIPHLQVIPDNPVEALNSAVDPTSCPGSMDGAITIYFAPEYNIAQWPVNLQVGYPTEYTLDNSNAIYLEDAIRFENLPEGPITFSTFNGCDNACGMGLQTTITSGECLGDLDGDNIVDVTDLLILLGTIGCQESDCIADFNQDGVVNTFDLLIFLGWF